MLNPLSKRQEFLLIDMSNEYCRMIVDLRGDNPNRLARIELTIESMSWRVFDRGKDYVDVTLQSDRLRSNGEYTLITQNSLFTLFSARTELLFFIHNLIAIVKFNGISKYYQLLPNHLQTEHRVNTSRVYFNPSTYFNNFNRVQVLFNKNFTIPYVFPTTTLLHPFYEISKSLSKQQFKEKFYRQRFKSLIRDISFYSLAKVMKDYKEEKKEPPTPPVVNNTDPTIIIDDIIDSGSISTTGTHTVDSNTGDTSISDTIDEIRVFLDDNEEEEEEEE